MLLELWRCFRREALSVQRGQQIALELDTPIAVVQRVRLALLLQILGWGLLDAALQEVLAEGLSQLAMHPIQLVRTTWEEVAVSRTMSVLELVVSV